MWHLYILIYFTFKYNIMCIYFTVWYNATYLIFIYTCIYCTYDMIIISLSKHVCTCITSILPQQHLGLLKVAISNLGGIGSEFQTWRWTSSTNLQAACSPGWWDGERYEPAKTPLGSIDEIYNLKMTLYAGKNWESWGGWCLSFFRA